MIKKLIYFKSSVNSELSLELAPGKRLAFFIINIIKLQTSRCFGLLQYLYFIKDQSN